MSPSARPFVPSFVVRGAQLAVALATGAGPLSCAGRSAAPTTPAVAEAFEMRLHRSPSVGHRGRLTVEGTDCLDLAAEMEGAFAGTAAPTPGSSVITGTIHATRRWVFPVEARLHGLARASTMTMELVTDVRPGSSGDREEVHLSLTQRRTETFAPLPD